HQQHLAQRHVERAVRLGRNTVRVELSLRIDQDDLLECVHCPEDRVQGAVREAEQLVRPRALGSGQPLAQRGLGERHHLTVLEVVVSLLRAAQRGVLNGLRAGGRRRGETHKQDEGAVPGHAAHSGSRVYRLRTVLLASTCTVSVIVLKPACSMRIVCRPGFTAYSTSGVWPASTPSMNTSPNGSAAMVRKPWASAARAACRGFTRSGRRCGSRLACAGTRTVSAEGAGS